MSKRQNLIPKYIEQFFKSCEIDDKLGRYSFFLIRFDGVILYQNKEPHHTLSQSSIGALLSGVWQAARALASFIPNNSEEAYRLSFDTASQGVYVIPIKVFNEELYLGLIYFDEMNPGLIKNKIRDMAILFSEFMENELKNHLVTTAPSGQAKKNSEYLFKDLSDVEMDRVFASLQS